MLSVTSKPMNALIYVTIGLGISIAASACSPLALPQTQVTDAVPTLSATEPLLPGYPGPTSAAATPLPPYPTDESPIVTPPPDEKVQVGEITEKEAPKSIFGYTYRQEQAITPKEGIVFNKLFVQYQGKETRLGDDDGSSDLEAMNEKYITWTYRSFFEDTQLPIKTGLYVYSVETAEQWLIAPGWSVGLSVINGDWVLYTSWENQSTGMNFPRNDSPGDIQLLFAYNIVSGKMLTLTENIPVILGRSPRSFYGVSGDRAGWVEYDMSAQTYSIKFSDLKDGSTQTLDTELKQPRFFSISSDLAVWRDTVWRGYSFSQDAVFTIPYAPKEWENVSGFVVTAKDGALEWSISNTPDGTTRYFTAPVIIK